MEPPINRDKRLQILARTVGIEPTSSRWQRDALTQCYLARMLSISVQALLRG